jgi:hypothetical protein
MNQRQRKKRDKRTEAKARTRVLFNTGTQVHAPSKGRGSYKRRSKADEDEKRGE